MRGNRRRIGRLAGIGLLACLLFVVFPGQLFSQKNPKWTSYTVSDGRMVISLSRNLDKASLDRFIEQYDLSDLDLPKLLFGHYGKEAGEQMFRQLQKMGWRVDANNQRMIILSKQMLAVGNLNDPGRRMSLIEDHPNTYDLFPAQNDNLVFGFNRFVGKYPFAVKDSLVSFFLRGHTSARQVLLAGSFTNWQHAALEMKKTDSGWTTLVPLGPGKYWYKFIIDGGWTIDRDNQLNEDDGMGNTNSVYYKTNTIFVLPGVNAARDVYLAGSFNKWNPGELPMSKGAYGWTIDLYLAEGTYTYKFLVDGKWMEDPANGARLPDGHNGFNSMLRLGEPHRFFLKGYTSARSVALAGSFNEWRTNDLLMHRTPEGWELPYTLGPGNYQYKFVVDGKWITDPADSLFVFDRDNHSVNSYLIVQPNYIFRLEGYSNARAVYLAGDFNDWTSNSLRMTRAGNAWVVSVHLSVGKHLYKFVVDGKWIKDPANPLWEENESHTGNSIIWMEEH
ncbi:glycogen-binding domain-containing protein [Puia dinghuensis]|nr:glycogen-binding domain-containing protein [Puia dinghuensis]